MVAAISPSTASAVQRTLATRLAVAGLSLCVLAIWMLQHPYGGIEYNDSSLYTLLALARLNPQSLSGEVFLRFGSQDQYTVFSPLFAAAIRLLDLEPAAALLTLAGQIAFFGCAWLLARRVMPARQALLAVGLLVALPSSYGAGNIFGYVESFLTPRQLTEALVLAALASTLARRYVMAGVCLLAAMLLHPIMAVAGIVVFACMQVAIPRPMLALGVATALLIASLVPILIIPGGVFAPFDATWLSFALDSTPYLFLSQWGLEDWAHLGGPIAVLAVGTFASRTSVVRRLCCAALITATCSLIVMLIYCDLLHVVIFTQMQPWRWLWLVEVLAALLLPVIARDCWQGGLPRRAAAVLLASAWVLRDNPAIVCVAILAIACAAGASRLTDPRRARLMFLGSCALLLISLAINLAGKFSYVGINETDPNHAFMLDAQWLRIWGGDGVLYCAVLALSWWAVERQHRLRSTLSLSAVAALVAVLLGPLAWRSWTTFHYTRALQTAFAPWRDEIPQHAQVIWPHTPVGAWYLLERPSYYSIHQVAGDIFSRTKAIEIHRRAQLVGLALQASVPPQAGRSAKRTPLLPADADRLNAHGLAVACSDPQLDFYVTWSPLGPTPLASIVPNGNKPKSQLHLYRCAELRRLEPRQIQSDAP